MASINSQEKKEFTDNIGDNIRKIRKRRGLTLREVAAKIDYTMGYVGLIEQGKSVPNSFVLKKLAEALDIPISVIYGEQSAVKNTEGLKDPILTSPKNREYLEVTKQMIAKDVSVKELKKAINFLTGN